MRVLLFCLLCLQGILSQEFHWEKLSTVPYPGKQDDIYFVDSMTGWYVNGYGTLYHTRDGGKEWTPQWTQQGSFFRTLAFIDKQVGFIGTVGTDYFPNVQDTIPLYRTRDGGLSWTPVSYQGPYVKGLCAIDVVQESYINHGVLDYKYHLYAVGRVGSPANLMISHDGGEHWVSKPLPEVAQMAFDIVMLDTRVGFIAAATHQDISRSKALILKTTDGGDTWKPVYQSNRSFETTWKISFPSDMVGYVTVQSYNPNPAIAQQRIAKTLDGGETWIELPLVEDATARQFGIGFINALHGFVGTMHSGYETRDGGQTWTKIDLGRACNKIRILRDDAQRVYGYAIGVEVFKLKTH